MRFALTLSLVALAALAACASKVSAPAPAPVPAAAAVDTGPKITEPFFGRTKLAVATLSPAASGVGLGVVNFSVNGTGVDVHVLATGLVPGSVHGFHIHDVGNCASADFMSAGNHFNPTHKPHGPQDKPHHAGDMPSLLADPAGKIDARFTLEGVTLGGADGFVGHAVILHAVADDYDAQPSGNAGARIACGVIAAQ